MKYAVAVIACIVTLVLFAFFGAAMGWMHGGGAVVQVLLWCTIIPFVWKITISLFEKESSLYSIRSTNPATAASSSLQTTSAVDSDKFYEQALNEIETDQKHKATWARAFSEEPSDEKKAQALYIKLRVRALLDQNNNSLVDENSSLIAKAEKEAISHYRLQGMNSFGFLCIEEWTVYIGKDSLLFRSHRKKCLITIDSTQTDRLGLKGQFDNINLTIMLPEDVRLYIRCDRDAYITLSNWLEAHKAITQPNSPNPVQTDSFIEAWFSS